MRRHFHIKPVWSSILALYCCTLNVRRKLNSRGELKIDPALSDPRPASSTDAEKEIKPLRVQFSPVLFCLWIVCECVLVQLASRRLKTKTPGDPTVNPLLHL